MFGLGFRSRGADGEEYPSEGSETIKKNGNGRHGGVRHRGANEMGGASPSLRSVVVERTHGDHEGILAESGSGRLAGQRVGKLAVES